MWFPDGDWAGGDEPSWWWFSCCRPADGGWIPGPGWLLFWFCFRIFLYFDRRFWNQILT